jgi:hypothetical protein
LKRQREFRASTYQLLAMIEELKRLERAKQGTAVATPEFIELAHATEDVARKVFRWSGMQTQMAEASPRGVADGELSATPLIEVEPRPLDRILANWREAQLRFELARPGLSEAELAAADVERLREEYRLAQAGLFEAATDGDA